MNEYQIYASIILIITFISIILNLIDEKRNFLNLKKMSAYSIQVNVYRGIREKENIYKKDLSIYKKIINSTELIPGDVIEIPENLFMPADIVLLNGK